MATRIDSKKQVADLLTELRASVAKTVELSVALADGLADARESGRRLGIGGTEGEVIYVLGRANVSVAVLDKLTADATDAGGSS